VFQTIKLDESSSMPYFGDRRCVGWFESFSEADYAIRHNHKNIHNDMYNYAIIEVMEDGVLINETNRVLYKWNGQQYEPIAEPEILSKYRNFGIG